MIAISAIERAIAKTEYLTPYISSNDKEPSWDGAIYVYHHAGKNHSKDDLAGRVPVQVKGHETDTPENDEISFPVEVVDMQNYLKDCGTIFFVVYFDKDGENEKIYYKNLLPFELKRLLKEAEGQGTKNIHLKPFPTDKDEKANILFNFIRDRQKQLASVETGIVTWEDLAKIGKMPELSFGYTAVGEKAKDPFEYMFSNGAYLYAQTEYGITLPIEHVERFEVAGTSLKGEVRVGESVFYTEYRLVFKPHHIREIHIGKSSVYRMEIKQNKAKFSFSLKGTLSERIKDSEFIISVFENGGFTVNGVEISTAEATLEEKESFNVEERKEILTGLYKVRETFEMLDVNADLDMDKMKEIDFHNLNLLVNAVADKKMIVLKDTGQPFGNFTVGNLKLLICAIKDEDTGKFKVYNFLDSPLVLKSTDKAGVMWDIPVFVLLSKQNLLECCNINTSKIIKQLMEVKYTDELANRMILFLLEILLAYDCEKSDKSFLMDLAEKVMAVIKEKDRYSSAEILRINELQIIKRKRSLNIGEKFELMKMLETVGESEDLMTAIYLLLDEQAEACIHFFRMTSERQEQFREYPIYNFWKKGKEEIANG